MSTLESIICLRITSKEKKNNSLSYKQMQRTGKKRKQEVTLLREVGGWCAGNSEGY